jgi:chaperonin cofactor prefoldin
MSEDKLDKLIEGQIEIKTKVEHLSKQKNDHEQRIRKLENKFWAALGTFFVGIATFIEGLFIK